MKHFTLAAFAAERRIATIVLFQGTHLESTRLRHLPIDSSKAIGSVREVTTRTLEQFTPDFLAICSPSEKASKRAYIICETVKEIADELGIPILKVDTETLMSAYGHPSLKRKEHVRRVGRTIWPGLNDAASKRALVDAATTGLYFQTERLFSLHEAQP